MMIDGWNIGFLGVAFGSALLISLAHVYGKKASDANQLISADLWIVIGAVLLGVDALISYLYNIQ